MSYYPYIFRYDPKTDTWTMVAPLSMPRDAVGVCLLGDRLYAVGGYDGQTYLNTMESYDPQTNEWTQVRLLPASFTSSTKTYFIYFLLNFLEPKVIDLVHFHVHFVKSSLTHIYVYFYVFSTLIKFILKGDIPVSMGFPLYYK